MTSPEITYPGNPRLLRGAALAGIAGVIGLTIGALLDARQALFAYLAAYTYLVTLVTGALLFLMIGHAMRAAWPTLLRRLTESIVATLPLLAALFLPILAGAPLLYPWVHPESIAEEEVRHAVLVKTSYLNLPGFALRAAFYFAAWILAGLLLLRLSRASDTDPSPGFAHRMYVLSSILLPLVALTVSFSAFDWAMSLTPSWSSTMFPVYWFAGGFVAAIALLTVLTAAADREGLIRGINDSHYYALGRLLLAFVIFWAYIAFFQFMLQWIADKPEEIPYYQTRAHGGWRAVTVTLAVARFVIPFFLLLRYDLKRRRGPLAAVAAWIVVTHYLDAHWLITPAARPAGPYRLVDLAALLALAGLTLAFGLHRLRGVPMVPQNDPKLPRALGYESV